GGSLRMRRARAYSPLRALGRNDRDHGNPAVSCDFSAITTGHCAISHGCPLALTGRVPMVGLRSAKARPRRQPSLRQAACLLEANLPSSTKPAPRRGPSRGEGRQLCDLPRLPAGLDGSSPHGRPSLREGTPPSSTIAAPRSVPSRSEGRQLRDLPRLPAGLD